MADLKDLSDVEYWAGRTPHERLRAVEVDRWEITGDWNSQPREAAGIALGKAKAFIAAIEELHSQE